MPPHSEAVLRYRIIDRCLTNPYKRYPSMEDIIAELRKELNADYSPNTIQKDINAMKKDETLGYFAPIHYSKRLNGYYYTDENYTIRTNSLNDKEIETIELAAGIIQHFKGYRLGETFSEAINKLFSALDIEKSKADENLKNAIQAEESTYMSGLENFDIFVRCIRQRRPVSFIHYSYQKKDFKAIVIHPYLLKESQKRWYLVGFSEVHNQLRIFGLDRVYDPIPLNKDFRQKDEQELHQLFHDRYGINTIEGHHSGPAEEIEIMVSDQMSNYVKSMPIHSSQRTGIQFSHGHMTILLRLIPTRELISLILSYGHHMVVLRPAWLNKEVQAEIKKMQKKNDRHFN
jgi:predicted DNA-binding transcriptional regulator YafY